MADLAPGVLLSRLKRDLDRSALRSRNGLKLLAGIGKPATGTSPKDTVFSAGKASVWRYRSDQRVGGPPLLIVYSLASRSYLFDLTPGNSFVEALLRDGFDVYLINWGEPDELESHNTP